MQRLVIIDGNSLINRAYYAIQRPMITRDGFYTQGIYGFLSMLTKIFADYEPTHMLVAFDRKAPTFRHKEFSEYKAGRKGMPMELAMEMPVLKDILKAKGIAQYEQDGFEADDIIGTTAKMAEAAGLEAYIITGDRDALQLATDTTKVVITKKGITEFKLYDDAAMQEEYGFDHLQFIDYKGLRGDTSDNIPGIPGVGEKTAIKLVQQFGSLENVIANSSKIESAKLREKVEEYALQAIMSKRLATIVTNMPVDYTIDDLKLKGEDRARLAEIYAKLEFKSYLAKLGPLETAEAGAAETIEAWPVVRDNARFLEALDAAEGEIWADVVSDDNHVELPSIEELQLASGGTVYLASMIGEDFLRRAFSGRTLKLSGCRLQRLYYILDVYGVESSGLSTAYDAALAEYVLAPSTKPSELAFEGPGEKFAALAAMRRRQSAAIAEQKLEGVYYDIELPLCRVLASMESNGIAVDRNALETIGKTLRGSIQKLEQEIYALAGEAFNIASPKQLGSILFEKLGLPAGKKTKSGYSTNAEVLERLAEDHPIVSKILEYRTLSKLESTYVQGLLPLIGPDGRIRAHFQQTVTATGRISCTEPNLQNIPVRKAEGRELRKLFTAGSENTILIGADYSQIELRILAALSGDPVLIAAFNDGLDIHRETASKVFGVPQEEVTPLMRANAKAVNFGVIYGMSSFGLSGELSITRKEAERYIQDYFKRFAAVKDFLDGCVADAKRTKSVRTLFGRKRDIPEIGASQFMVRQLGERLAMNTPIQGTAADIMKIAMIRVWETLRREVPDAKLILQIHDELIIEAPEEDAARVKAILTDCMEHAASLSVRLEVAPSQGTNWYELKE